MRSPRWREQSIDGTFSPAALTVRCLADGHGLLGDVVSRFEQDHRG